MMKIEPTLEAGEDILLGTSAITRPADLVSGEATSLTSGEAGVDRDLLRLECLHLALKQDDLTPNSDVIARAGRMFAFVIGSDPDAERITQDARVEQAFEAAKAAAIWAVTYAYEVALQRDKEAGLAWLKFCMDIDFREAKLKLSS